MGSTPSPCILPEASKSPARTLAVPTSMPRYSLAALESSDIVTPEDAHLEAELLGEGDHLAEDVAVRDGDVVRQVVRHQRVAGHSHVCRHEGPLARRPLPPGVAHLLGEL